MSVFREAKPAHQHSGFCRGGHRYQKQAPDTQLHNRENYRRRGLDERLLNNRELLEGRNTIRQTRAVFLGFVALATIVRWIPIAHAAWPVAPRAGYGHHARIVAGWGDASARIE